ncbi:MAG TPA: hypothetical protein VGT98_16055, partial [Candidatus Elarobacter sp.]|nr:hypothetical protein [Candidatus Elarobacter sp.]
DLSRQVSEIGATFKIELVAAVGITPTLLSLLVIAAGIHLQTRATELLLPRAIADGDRNDLNDDPVPRVE